MGTDVSATRLNVGPAVVQVGVGPVTTGGGVGAGVDDESPPPQALISSAQHSSAAVEVGRVKFVMDSGAGARRGRCKIAGRQARSMPRMA
jgi:hypothetical protein